MTRTLLFLSAAITLHFCTVTALFARAEPSRGKDRAGVCAAFEGAAFTFCVAFCEARQCNRRDAEDKSCATLRRAFARVAAYVLPCNDHAIAVGPARSAGPLAQWTENGSRPEN